MKWFIFCSYMMQEMLKRNTELQQEKVKQMT